MLSSQVNRRFIAQDKNLCKKAKPVNPKGNQPWIFTERTDAKAPTLWPPEAKSWLTGKDSGAEKDCGQEEKGTAEEEMAGWHHRLDGHEFEWAPGVGDGQWGLDAAVHGVAKSRAQLSEQQQRVQWHTQSVNRVCSPTLCVYCDYHILHKALIQMQRTQVKLKK